MSGIRVIIYLTECALSEMGACATGQTNSQASHYHLFHERQEETLVAYKTKLNEHSGLPMHNVRVRKRKPCGRGQAQGRTGKTEAAKTHCSQLTSPAGGR
jgi:hypothetical protein